MLEELFPSPALYHTFLSGSRSGSAWDWVSLIVILTKWSRDHQLLTIPIMSPRTQSLSKESAKKQHPFSSCHSPIPLFRPSPPAPLHSPPGMPMVRWIAMCSFEMGSMYILTCVTPNQLNALLIITTTYCNTIINQTLMGLHLKEMKNVKKQNYP